MNFPRRIIQKQHEAESYAILLYALRRVGIFRNLTDNDYGIDFEIELVRDERMTGKYIKIQVKSSEELFVRKSDNVPTVSGIKQSTLWYWAELSFSTNVVVYAVDLKTENIYMTKPIFWQASQLIDESDTSKTIEFLPVEKEHAIVAEVLTKVFSVTPTIRDVVSCHMLFLRQLKDFLELYVNVFHYDSHVPINEPELFRYFLDACSQLLWGTLTRDAFPEEDRNSWASFEHWQNKNQYGELCNYTCQVPMKILMPIVLAELKMLRKAVLDGRYYWAHKNPAYLKMVFKHKIPDTCEHDDIRNISYEYETAILMDDSEIVAYLQTLIRS